LIEISKQPESKTIRAGQDVQLSVSAVGPGPLKYQWKKDGVPLPSESSSSLLISKASSTNSGNYSVAITSNSGSTESLAADLVIEDPKASSQRQAAKTSENDRDSHEPLKPQNEGTLPTEVKSVPDFMKNSPEEFSKTLTKPKELPVKDTMRIGLIWNTSDSSNDVDLDLYVRPAPTSQELSFRNTKSAEGIHYKDFSDPRASHGFELVDLSVPVKPESISVWVNVFKGQSEKGFTGELRVLYANCLRVIPVRIPATKGNQGVDGPKREGSPYWSKVQVAQSLTLTSK
jgi:hypothetical protein